MNASAADAVAAAAAVPLPAAAPASRRADWLVGQLPSGMLSEDFFVRFVRIFQAQAETLLSHADTLPHLADPRLAPIEMVRYMGSWLGAPGVDDAYGETVQRAVLQTVARTLPWRGTRLALQSLLELYSAGPATVEDGGGVFEDGVAPTDTAWVRLSVESTGPLRTEHFLALVLDEVPAHVRAEVFVAGARIWPRKPGDLPAPSGPAAVEPGTPPAGASRTAQGIAPDAVQTRRSRRRRDDAGGA